MRISHVLGYIRDGYRTSQKHVRSLIRVCSRNEFLEVVTQTGGFVEILKTQKRTLEGADDHMQMDANLPIHMRAHTHTLLSHSHTHGRMNATLNLKQNSVSERYK